MKELIEITDINDERLDPYLRLTGAQLRSKLEPQRGIFIAESPAVIEIALDRGYEPISVLTDKRLISGAVERVINKCGDAPIYTASREILTSMTGFELTRGALCAFKRPKMPSVSELIANARRVCVLEGVADSTNVGAILRSAAALGFDAMLVAPNCCDPFCRRTVRVSMGTVFQLPWTRFEAGEWPEGGIELLHSAGFKCAAMALTDESIGLCELGAKEEQRLAVILGSEGFGLDQKTISLCDYVVKIPMSLGVDSLNVACAATLAFWELRDKEENC